MVSNASGDPGVRTRLIGVSPSSPRVGKRRYPGLLVLGALVVAAWLTTVVLDCVGGAETVGQGLGLAAALVLVPLQAILSVTPFPGEAIAFVTCRLYGFWLGTLLSWLAWMLGAFLQYGVARRLAVDWNLELEKLPAWLKRFPACHPGFLVLGRFLPGGFHIVNSAAGAFRVPLWRHAWCAAVGIAPFALIISALANAIVEL